MTKPFYERLNNYYLDVGRVLRGEASAASIFPNTTDIGMSREQVYAEFLRLHVPSSCNVFLGGFLFNNLGDESNQLDVLVTDDMSLQFNFQNKDGSGKSFANVNGCIAVASVKSNLTSAQLVEALDNIASIPDKEPLGKRVMPLARLNGYEDWPFKIIYASDGISLDTFRFTWSKYLEHHPDIPTHKTPNLIHVSGKYVLVRVDEQFGTTRDGTVVPLDTYHPTQGERIDSYALLEAVRRVGQIAVAFRYIIHDYNAVLNNTVNLM